MPTKEGQPVISGPEHSCRAPLISQISKGEKNISYRRPSEVKRSLEEGHFLLTFEGEDLVGWIEHLRLWREWSGLFSLYVLPPHQSHGIGSRLLEEATKQEEEKFIFAATLNSSVAKKLESLGYAETSWQKLPPLFFLNLLKNRYGNLDIIHNLPYLFHRYQFFLHSPKEHSL